MQFLSLLVGWSLRNRAVVLAATLIFVFVGIHSALNLPIDAVPDITTIQVQVITAVPALSPAEVEHYVTVPVERAMSGIPKLTELRSISKYGLSVVTVVFSDDTPIYFARQMVSERMREAEDAVPARYGKPEMGPISTGLGEIFQFVVRGEGYSLMQLEEALDWYIAPQLRTVPGVVEVNSFGGEDRQYQIYIEPGRLQAAGLSIKEVAEAVERGNANAGGGYIEHHREQLVIGTSGLVRNLDDLKSIVVGATPQGVPITLATLAEVRFGPRLRRGAASMNGVGETVIGVAMMLMGENSRVVTEGVKAKIAQIAPSLPSGMSIEPFYDRSELVDRTIHTVVKNLLEGAALVMIVLLLLLGDWRAGLVVASTIPLAMLFAVMVMRVFGVSGNLMSLGAIDFGLIVDGAVIIVENAVRRLSEARQKQGTALSAAHKIDVIEKAAIEVRRASIFGEVIIAVVYLPILTLRGLEAKLFHPMAMTVLFALLGAVIVSLTVVPVFASYFLVAKTEEGETWLMRQVRRFYLPMLGRASRHPARTLGIGLVALVLGLGLSPFLGAEFVPQLDEGDVVVEVRRLPGVALSESIATDLRMQKKILQIPEVIHAISRVGSPEVAVDPMGIEQSDLYVKLQPRNRWRAGLSKDELSGQIAAAAESAVPEAAIAMSQPIEMRSNELIEGIRSDAAAQIYGTDLELLQRLGDKAAALIKKIPGATDVRATQSTGLNYIRIHPDRARLARYGLSIDEVNLLAETLAVGRDVGAVLEGDRRFGIVIKTAHNSGDLDSLRALPMKATSGQMVPLGDVADISIETGPAIVNREKQSRRLAVEFNVRDRDLVSTVNQAQDLLARELQLPSGYRVEWGGQFQNFISARERLLVVIPLTLALILFMLWLAFGALKPALFIFISIPFAVVGGIAALWLRGIPFSISAGVGFIALFGVAVLNGLVLLSFCRHLESEGMSAAAAIVCACERRLRPILMTGLVAAFGFIPMALSYAPGSEVQRPLATVVIGGLLSTTALVLLFFPVFYVWVHLKGPGRRDSKRGQALVSNA